MKCSQEIKTRIAIVKEAFNKKKRLLCGIYTRLKGGKIGQMFCEEQRYGRSG